MKKTIILLSLALVSWGAFAQHDHSKTNMPEMHAKKAEKISDAKIINVEKSRVTADILTNYLALKDALVTDNSKNAASSGKKLFDSFSKFDISSQPKTQQKELGEIIEDASKHAEHISENSGILTTNESILKC